ncbi:MAG: hypothetical protein EZS28_014095 [Streblomastix strix]|uniref:Uncharacterized protein n=1 Tax=Streblomastix strix TaxID=222440 RepID=A0A5J4W686_9EUKA|nr:MAG: hypothetical protein EZS28_014095 [Streblomastix strix]
MVGSRTGIRPIEWPFFKKVKEFNKTGTVKAGTVCEFRYTKVHHKDTRRARSRATGDWRRDRKVSQGRTTAKIAGHQTTINSKVGDQ